MKNLYGKLALIQKTGLSVAKNGTNNFHKYSYVMAADVIAELDEQFTKHNLLLHASMEEVTTIPHGDKFLTRAKIRYTITDADSGESLSQVFFGDGEDKLDKGIYKSATGALKYFIINNFRVATGDDPENDGPVKSEAKAEAIARTAADRAASPRKPSGFVKPSPNLVAATAGPIRASAAPAAETPVTNGKAGPLWD